MSEIHQQLRAFCNYFRVFKGDTERSVKTYQYEVGAFIESTSIDTACEIDRLMVENYILQNKLDRGWSAKTIRNRLIALRIFLDWCIEQGTIGENPAKELDLPRLPKKLPRHRWKEEALKLLDWARHYASRTRSSAIGHLRSFLCSCSPAFG